VANFFQKCLGSGDDISGFFGGGFCFTQTGHWSTSSWLLLAIKLKEQYEGSTFQFLAVLDGF